MTTAIEGRFGLGTNSKSKSNPDSGISKSNSTQSTVTSLHMVRPELRSRAVSTVYPFPRFLSVSVQWSRSRSSSSTTRSVKQDVGFEGFGGMTDMGPTMYQRFGRFASLGFLMLEPSCILFACVTETVSPFSGSLSRFNRPALLYISTCTNGGR
jgi:hypothetical protein